MIHTNMGHHDRAIRSIVAASLFIIGYFWLPGAYEVVALAGALVLTVSALVGVCPAYVPFHVSSTGRDMGKFARGAVALLLLLTAVGGSYGSVFFTKKIFLEQFSVVNDAYKQALFNTGQGDREKSVATFGVLQERFAQFTSRYEAYRPYFLKGDSQFGSEMSEVGTIIRAAASDVSTGDLHRAHITLEGVRPIFQDLLKRNGLSMLAVYLVDFHDAMEVVLTAAQAEDAAGVLAAYGKASESLAAVESAAQDDAIRAIRTNLDQVRSLAEAQDVAALPQAAAALKSSFVSVYLQRG